MVIRKLVLYGAGKRCKKICKLLKSCSNMEIVAILDTDSSKWGMKIGRYRISPPERIENFPDADICIAVADENIADEIRGALQQVWNYDMKIEVHYNELCLEALKANEEIKQYIYKNVKTNNYEKESILFVSYNGFSLGGIQAWTKDICEALIKDGKENIYVVATRDEYEVPPLLQNCMLYIDEQEIFSVDSILNVIDTIIDKMPCKVVTTQPDNTMLAPYLIKCCYPEMIKIITTIRGASKDIYKAYMDYKEIPDAFIGVSQDIMKDLIQMGIEPKKVYSMCVPFECEETLTREYTEDVSFPIHVGYAGRMEYSQKRMDLLIKLVQVLVAREICFVMDIAGDGVARQELADFIASNHLEKKVRLLGEIDRQEIPSFWKKQDVCVNVADYEGRCHSIIEAMGNGAVPVVTATSGVREDITDGENGYIVPIGDYCAMAERIEYLANHRERLSLMGKLAHDVVYPKSRIESHLEFWKDILSRH